MDLKAFLFENCETPEEREVAISERFTDGEKAAVFKLRAVSEKENVLLRKSCRVKTADRPDGVLDRDRYLLKLAAAAVVWPELKSSELQQSWGVRGEEELLSKMLTAGEFAKLLSEVRKVCGFDEDPEELKNSLKKEYAGETAN